MDDAGASIRKGFKPSDGPYFQSLSRTLTSLNVERQAYQGGTFVGNHVNKLLKVKLLYRYPAKKITGPIYIIAIKHQLTSVGCHACLHEQQHGYSCTSCL